MQLQAAPCCGGLSYRLHCDSFSLNASVCAGITICNVHRAAEQRLRPAMPLRWWLAALKWLDMLISLPLRRALLQKYWRWFGAAGRSSGG